MGTNVFFSENPDPPPMDPNFESIPTTMFKYHSKTDKVLRMERIFITPKQDNEEEDEPTETQSDDDVPQESYLEALNHLLKPGELPPRTLSGSDILKPGEFQTFFRPQLNQIDDKDKDEGMDETVEISENNERTESNVSEASGSEAMEVSLAKVKIETIKQEKQ